MRWLIKTIYYTYTMRGTDKNTQKNLFCLCVSVFEYKNAKHAHTHFFPDFIYYSQNKNVAIFSN